MAKERPRPAFLPCLWCARPIDAGRPSPFCSDDCRLQLDNSIVKRIYDASETAAEELGYADFPEFDRNTREIFQSRIREALSTHVAPRKEPATSTRGEISGCAYNVVLEPNEDGGYTALVPALPSIVTQGESAEGAMARAREAVELTLEDMRAAHETIPAPD